MPIIRMFNTQTLWIAFRVVLQRIIQIMLVLFIS